MTIPTGTLRFTRTYDFSCLARWAWSASRAVDYLVTLTEVDKSKIGLAGHSRHGKQALLAAAFDERIAAVIPSSGNTGECDPWRYTTDMFVNESIELLTAGCSPTGFTRGCGSSPGEKISCRWTRTC